MKIVVIGGTDLIGSRVVQALRERGHEALAASPNTGVNTLTGEGLAEALTGARVVIASPTRPRSRTRRRWTSSPPPAETFWPPRRRPGSVTTSPCQWSGPSGCRPAVTSAPSWGKRS